MTTHHVVILAAGLGSRLGSAGPKCLNELPGGRTILRQQVDNIRSVMGPAAPISIVVGFNAVAIMEHVGGVRYIYNQHFATTNTNRSLLLAVDVLRDSHLIWMNGDVVFDPEVLTRLRCRLDAGDSAIAVNTSRVADEEVKYVTDSRGLVSELSKSVSVEDALGEAVGVNAVHADHLGALRTGLAACGDQDYFERGIELMIERGGVRVRPVDISDLYAVEVDTPEDLRHARALYSAVLQAQDAQAAGEAARPEVTHAVNV